VPNVNMTYEEMEQAAGQLNSAHDQISEQLGQLKARIDTLVDNGGFTTDVASKSFQAGYEEFNNGVMQTLQGLQVMSQYLHSAAQRFQELDQSTTIQVH
jgi:WXG100 family type VII secretion target